MATLMTWTCLLVDSVSSPTSLARLPKVVQPTFAKTDHLRSTCRWNQSWRCLHSLRQRDRCRVGHSPHARSPTRRRHHQCIYRPAAPQVLQPTPSSHPRCQLRPTPASSRPRPSSPWPPRRWIRRRFPRSRRTRRRWSTRTWAGAAVRYLAPTVHVEVPVEVAGSI